MTTTWPGFLSKSGDMGTILEVDVIHQQITVQLDDGDIVTLDLKGCRFESTADGGVVIYSPEWGDLAVQPIASA